MNKKGLMILAIIISILIIGGVGYYFYNQFQSNKKDDTNSYETEKTSTNSQKNQNNSSEENNSTNETTEKNINKNEESAKNKETSKDVSSQQQEQKAQYTETQIATFSTKIYSQDSARQNNIKITCNTLNGTIVKNGSTFSFCNTVGQASTAKGYQEADIYDNNGNKKKGLGGGNCQVSSTLYNAVLAVSNLVVTERHAHSKSVPYVSKGKDAAVAYGSYDFKFRNNSGNDIKINCSTDGKSVIATLISLEQIGMQ